MRRFLKHLACLLAYGSVGAGVALLALYVVLLRSQPDLQPWHRVELHSEFRAADAVRVHSLDDYLALEARLFDELNERVYEPTAGDSQPRFMRYTAGSRADPRHQSPDWNRTFELRAQSAVGGALLLHGLSDSPYSLRTLAARLQQRGYWVVGLRLPGHGTVPEALKHVQWEDFAAAVRIGARHLRSRIGDRAPLVIVGYSNGAALAVQYALGRLQGESVPRADALVLLSPAIGVAPVASLAVWQSRIGLFLREEKMGWTDIQPEYDPYKYASFAVNAGHQAHRLTRYIAAQIASLGAKQQIYGMPPILAFQSVVDDTVSTPAVIDTLLRRIAPVGHELVLFDVNRHSDLVPFYRDNAMALRERLLHGDPLPFDVTIVTNAAVDSDEVVAQRRRALGNDVERHAPGLHWPLGVFSLSHVAVPFPPDDPVYGRERPAKAGLVYLGRLDIAGERGVLALPPSQLLRLRHNPFFAYLEQRFGEFLAGVEAKAASTAR